MDQVVSFMSWTVVLAFLMSLLIIPLEPFYNWIYNKIKNTMKANELMIGDWVQVPSLIDNVEHYDAWCKVKQLRDCDLDVIGFKELKYDEIEPIPLTPEILEKNGWETEYFGERQEWWLDKTKFPIVRYSANDALQHNGIVLKYVHQLQHALRLLGIDKEIEL